jgi:hypothetical protein
MRNLFKKGLPKPTNQQTEVFYLLLKDARRHKNEKQRGISRKEFMDDAFVLNAPDVIRKLRREGIIIHRHEVEKKNKYGRDIRYSRYYIPLLFDETMEFLYLKMNK